MRPCWNHTCQHDTHPWAHLMSEHPQKLHMPHSQIQPRLDLPASPVYHTHMSYHCQCQKVLWPPHAAPQNQPQSPEQLAALYASVTDQHSYMTGMDIALGHSPV